MNASTPARYIMIGGFLGAGKTTAVAQLAGDLVRRGLRVGLITNDQGDGLVDTAVLRSRGFATEEIPGGCFCCRFNSLMDAAHKLTESDRPDVFVAEPVGSCTDLVATVTYPLRRIYGNDFTIAPLSVLVDPQRARRVLGLGEGRPFSEKVSYIYRKQLEEADIIVVNKVDQLSEAELAELKAALAAEFPHAEILSASARDGAGLDDWFTRLREQTQVARKTMEVDYEVYADGEALLGWLNATIEIKGAKPFDANEVLKALAVSVQEQLVTADGEIAHLKMTFSPDEGLGDIAVINLVRNDFVPELAQRLEDPAPGGQLILNLRAEADPATLKQAVEKSLAVLATVRPDLGLKLDHLEHFRPGKPQPTHRDLNAV